jgi:hypothetical protein
MKLTEVLRIYKSYLKHAWMRCIFNGTKVKYFTPTETYSYLRSFVDVREVTNYAKSV